MITRPLLLRLVINVIKSHVYSACALCARLGEQTEQFSKRQLKCHQAKGLNFAQRFAVGGGRVSFEKVERDFAAAVHRLYSLDYRAAHFSNEFRSLRSADMLRDGAISEGRAETADIQEASNRSGLSVGPVRRPGENPRGAQLSRSQSRLAVDQLDVVGVLGRVVGQRAQLCGRREKGENRRRRGQLR